MSEKLGNITVALKPWEKYGKKRIYLHCSHRAGGKLPGKGYDGGYFDSAGYHSGKGGWIDPAKYHNPVEWAAIEKVALKMLE